MAIMFNNTGAGQLTLRSANEGIYTLTFPDSPGVDGFFLQTDGEGKLEWATAGSGSMPDGNSKTPGLAFIGDKDTGFFRPLSNTLAISTSGKQRMMIDDNGNVVINGGQLETSTTSGFLYLPTVPGTPTGTPTSYSGHVPLVVDTSNNVIYGYNPTTKVWTNLTSGLGGVPGGTDQMIQFNDDGAFSGDARLSYSKSTNVLTIKGTIASHVSMPTAPSYSFVGDSDTGICSPAADTVNISTNGKLRLSATNTGNIVIGCDGIQPTATDGFLYIAGMSGSPSGTPTLHKGRYPLTFDNAHKKLHIHDGIQWHDVVSPRIKSETWSATRLVDWSNADIIRITLIGNTALTLVGGVDGYRYMLELTQDNNGDHNVVFGEEVRFGTSNEPYTATQTPNKKDRIELIYDGTSGTYDVLSVNKGF